MNISFLKENIEEIVKIDDVFLPISIHRVINSEFPQYKKELYENQKEFIFKYRHGEYSKENESFKDEEDRLFKLLFNKHPELVVLTMDSLDTDEYNSPEFYDF